MSKWSDGHPRKTSINKIVDDKLPHECDTCKRPRWFERVDEDVWRCPKCNTRLYFE